MAKNNNSRLKRAGKAVGVTLAGALVGGILSLPAIQAMPDNPCRTRGPPRANLNYFERHLWGDDMSGYLIDTELIYWRFKIMGCVAGGVVLGGILGGIGYKVIGRSRRRKDGLYRN